MKKKIIAMIVGLAMVAMIVPSSATAVTAAELQEQINDLMATLADLQTQLADLTGEPTGTITGCTITSFTRNLKVGMSGDDVKCLQIVLNTASDTQLSAGVGSPGQETSYFGPKTKAAVIKFQEKYTADILAVYNLTVGTGYVGTTTRAKLNTLLAAGEQEEEEEEEEEEEVGDLTVKLLSTTPASATVATGASADFTGFSLKASSDGDVKISKIYVTRSGLSANSDVEKIKVIDAETGEYKGSVGSLNVDNRAMISFVPKLVIPAGETKEFYIRAGVPSTGTTAGKTIVLGIAVNSDIVSDATDVAGAPATGNAMTVVALTIGSATVSEITITDSQPDVGETDVSVLEFKLLAGATEPITVETITVKQAGTSDATDTENIELYDITNSKSLGTVDNWSTEEKATWSDLNITIAKGKTQRFRVRLDVVSGVTSSTKTINADLIDGTDVLITVKGDTYGFYITPARDSWNGLGVDQTIAAGALAITKSASTPATGNIAVGDEIELAVFDFDAKGEDIKITGITIGFTLSGGIGNGDITNVGIYDEDDEIVAGPKAVTAAAVDFSDTFIVPVGIHEYTVKATLVDSCDTGDTITVDVTTPGDTTILEAVGMTSGDEITATPTSGNVSANAMTVAAGALTITTLASPAARSVTSPTTDYIWATFSFAATASGEDINVTNITVTDSLDGGSAGAAYADIDNMELWADLTSGTSTRGDVYETRISDTEQGDAADEAFVLNQTLVIPKGGFKRVALVADLVSNETVGNHTFSIDYNATATVTASGAVTGETVTPATAAFINSNEQTMTVGTASLTVTKDDSSPASNIIIGNTDKVILAVFRLASDNVEDLDLDQITLSATHGSNATFTFAETVYFYEGTTLLGSVPGTGASAILVLDDGTLTIPADGNKKITIKADLLRVDGTLVADNQNVKVGLETNDSVQTTGLGSGSSIDSDTSTAYGSTMQIYESRPYFSVRTQAPVSPSGNLNPSSNTLVAIFDVAADEGEDITFETGDSSALEIRVDATIADTASNYITITLKDQDGQVLGVDSVDISSNGVLDGAKAEFTTYNAFGGSGTTTTTYSWRIAAGTTEKLYVYATTTNFEDDGDFIQVWLDDEADNNCVFGIDGSGTNQEGIFIFKGDIYAGSFVNPS